MKRPSFKKIVKVDIYKKEIGLLIEPNDKKAAHLLSYWEKEDLARKDIEGSGAKTYVLKSGCVVIWIRNINNHPVLMHECIHAALGILDHIGIEKIDKNNEESLTYLSEYIFKSLIKK